jgi:hypothetical protein
VADLSFEVGHDRLSAELSETRDLVLVPDHGLNLVSSLGQKATDVLADLTVRPGDEHPHDPVLASWWYMVFLLGV